VHRKDIFCDTIFFSFLVPQFKNTLVLNQFEVLEGVCSSVFVSTALVLQVLEVGVHFLFPQQLWLCVQKVSLFRKVSKLLCGLLGNKDF